MSSCGIEAATVSSTELQSPLEERGRATSLAFNHPQQVEQDRDEMKDDAHAFRSVLAATFSNPSTASQSCAILASFRVRRFRRAGETAESISAAVDSATTLRGVSARAPAELLTNAVRLKRNIEDGAAKHRRDQAAAALPCRDTALEITPEGRAGVTSISLSAGSIVLEDQRSNGGLNRRRDLLARVAAV
jgi:hypothetical protein